MNETDDSKASAGDARNRFAGALGVFHAKARTVVVAKIELARKIWKCKACSHQFSITSGTLFASRKLPIRTYLLAIAIFVNGAKGHAAAPEQLGQADGPLSVIRCDGIGLEDGQRHLDGD